MPHRANSVRVILLRPRTEVRLSDIIRIDGAASYSILYFVDGQQLKLALPINELLPRLPGLVRIHKRHVINLAYVTIVYRHQPALKLSTGEILPVARRRRNQVRILFAGYKQQLINPLNAILMDQQPEESPKAQTPSLVGEIVPVAAQLLTAIPNRQMRNKAYVDVGSLKMPEGNVRVKAFQKDGSLLIMMPDNEGFLLDTSIVATQCYKYWKLKKETTEPSTGEQTNEINEQPTNESTNE
ncbi:LytTR family DNA-binding domain-containing protein [Spirosoma sp.]|uniref:LytTR family DNA-binding domain-containing protein n=1 Tax=Spirosoma sp. TaxID=1899569 RepID=UPI00261DDA24|nr:LytTR family DNA-binding domain-containing protein [Spirosoma sp.]MCX6216528.1 LytTR family DNA-binding domain-containing protein [Spirosoma sp.]